MSRLFLNNCASSRRNPLRTTEYPSARLKTLGTPRRITLSIKDLKTLQESQETEVVGPPKRIAYDENGEPTKAAIGFAKTQGVELSALRIVETERGEYVAASKLERGVPTREILKTLLTEWIEALSLSENHALGDRIWRIACVRSLCAAYPVARCFVGRYGCRLYLRSGTGRTVNLRTSLPAS